MLCADTSIRLKEIQHDDRKAQLKRVRRVTIKNPRGRDRTVIDDSGRINDRTRMCCPMAGCYGRPWLRHWREMRGVAEDRREVFPAGHREAWYRCFGCDRNIRIPPREDDRATDANAQGIVR